MKINEIIQEGRNGKKPKKQTVGDTGEWRFRDVGGYDRVYHLNRIMMATAMADGQSKSPVKMNQSSWFEKYNTARPYTEAEHNMMRSAFKTVDSDYKETEQDHQSKEPEDTHKSSPVPQNSGNHKKKK